MARTVKLRNWGLGIIEFSRIRLPALSFIEVAEFPPDRVRRTILKLEGSRRVFTTFLVDVPEVRPLPKTGKAVVLDVGIEKLPVTSDGKYFPNARPCMIP